MIVGCYDMNLYCDLEDENAIQSPDGYSDGHPYDYFPHRFTGETRSECIKEARKSGWLISSSRQLCPIHSRKSSK